MAIYYCSSSTSSNGKRWHNKSKMINSTPKSRLFAPYPELGAYLITSHSEPIASVSLKNKQSYKQVSMKLSNQILSPCI